MMGRRSAISNYIIGQISTTMCPYSPASLLAACPWARHLEGRMLLRKYAFFSVFPPVALLLDCNDLRATEGCP